MRNSRINRLGRLVEESSSKSRKSVKERDINNFCKLLYEYANATFVSANGLLRLVKKLVNKDGTVVSPMDYDALNRAIQYLSRAQTDANFYYQMLSTIRSDSQRILDAIKSNDTFKRNR